MANEIITKNNMDVKVLNQSNDEEIIGLQIKCKRIKDDTKKINFISVKGMLYLPVYELPKKDGEDLIFRGYHNRWIDVHFTMDAFNNVPEGCKVHKPDDLKTGMLYLEIGSIQVPSKYVITKDEDDNDVYPQIWIRGGICGLVPYKPNKDMFNYHKPEKILETDPETGEVTLEDPESETFTDQE